MAEMVNLESSDTAKDNIERLKEIFPDIVRDGEVDFKALQLLLGEEIATDNESYKFEWVGKKNCYKSIQTPSNGTLKYVKEDSLNPDTSENLIIEGDNLEVLKLLQSGYKNSVKMIYIDPPYNTGNDFVYPDNFKTPLENYLEITGQKVGGETTQSKKSKEGRKHTQWLNMMFPRLLLSRTLLKDDGVIFISIDDNEVDNLKRICNEIFGEENFEGHIHWRRRHNQPNDKTKMIGLVAEHILVYSKNKEEYKKSGVGKLELTGDFSNPDNDPKGDWATKPWKVGSDQGGSQYKIKTPSGKIYDEIWMGEEKTFKKLLKDNRIIFPKNGDGAPRKKYYRFEREEEGQSATNWWSHDKFGYNQEANDVMTKIFDGQKNIFSNPKSTILISNLIRLSNAKSDDIVLDFFSGSGSTGQAVLELNREENKDIKFILVQLQEVLDPKQKGQKVAYEFLKSIKKPTVISEITKERVRRVINGYGKNPKPLDGGFKVFKLDNSNYKVNEAIKVNRDSDKDEIIKKLRQQFKTSTVYDESMVDGYTELNVIYENILKEGYSLNSDIEVIEDITECKIYKITDNVKKSKFFYITFDKVDTEITTHKEFAGISNDTLFICFDNNLSDSDKQNLSKTFRLKTM
ncbi:site-specific DNA-methyltransferase [Sulfurovum sp. TSL1]|uniref:site-specific DNA-methyltransferase n=1 Tax=Sulfurovum sp. TSL1 TaxID=2826994 RepID=UPI001CC804D9|nr:site-specific DNA-methyltransferase [Sulfurovum sp. TSL1]GIT98518.1 site-specific DNA-methyltransferase [Sulfurovum sp. TSL1]